MRIRIEEHVCEIALAEDVLDFLNSLLLSEVRVPQTFQDLGLEDLQLLGFSFLFEHHFGLTRKCVILQFFLRFEFVYYMLLMFDFGSLIHNLQLKPFLLCTSQIFLFMSYYLLLVFERLILYGHCILQSLLLQFLFLCDARKSVSAHLVDQVASLVQCNYFLFLPLLLDLLLLDLVLKHLLCSGARFLDLFDCLFLLGLQETDSVVELSGVQLFLLLQLSGLGYGADSQHTKILDGASALPRGRGLLENLGLTVTFFEAALFGDR